MAPGEFFISPVVEFFIKSGISLVSPNVFAQSADKAWCKFNEHVIIRMPHCIRDRSLWKYIKVYYIETDYDQKATEVPNRLKDVNAEEADCFFTVNENCIEIHTKHFTKFWCTCSPLKSHEIQMEAVVFGSHVLSGNEQIINVKTYLCDALYHINDYKQVFTM